MLPNQAVDIAFQVVHFAFAPLGEKFITYS